MREKFSNEVDAKIITGASTNRDPKNGPEEQVQTCAIHQKTTERRAKVRDSKGRYTGDAPSPTTPITATEFSCPHTARLHIREAILAWFAQAILWLKTQASLDINDHTTCVAPPPVLVIAASPGAGKSHITRETLAQIDVSAIQGDVVYYALTHKLAKEAYEHIRELKLHSHLTLGRSALKDLSTDETMCRREKIASLIAKTGKSIPATLCKNVENEGENCKFYAECDYVNQWSELDETTCIRIEASAHLTTRGEASGRPTGLRIIDESFWRLCVSSETIDQSEFLNADPPTHDLEENIGQLKIARGEALRALAEKDGLLNLNYSHDELLQFASFERKIAQFVFCKDASDTEILSQLNANDHFNQVVQVRVQFWKILAECKRRNFRYSQRIVILNDHVDPQSGQKRDVLCVNWRTDPPRDVPVLILDADATPEIIKCFYPQADIVKVSLKPNAEVIQVSDKTFSMTSLKNSKTLRHEVAELVRTEVWKDALFGGGGVLAIASKKIVRLIFEDAGHCFKNMADAQITQYMRNTKLYGADWLWFGPASLGVNTYKNHGTAVVIGREEVPPDTLDCYLRALKGDQGTKLRYAISTKDGGKILPQKPVSYLMADGSGVENRVTKHPDPLGCELQLQTRELATRQGFERLRFANAAEKKQLILVSKVPIPDLPVDHLLPWDEIRPSRLFAAMAEAHLKGGVLRLNPAGLADDAPDTFHTEAAAKNWLDENGREQIKALAGVCHINQSNVFEPRLLKIRMKGQRGRSTNVLVVCKGDPIEIIMKKFPTASIEDI